MRTMWCFVLMVILITVAKAADVSVLKIIPPPVETSLEENRPFKIILANNGVSNLRLRVRLSITCYSTELEFVDSLDVDLTGLSNQEIVFQWKAGIYGHYIYKLMADKEISYGDFYIFGMRHTVDIVVSEALYLVYDRSINTVLHGQLIYQAIKYEDPTLKVDILWDLDVQTVIKYAIYHGAMAVVQSYSDSRFIGYFFNNKDIMYFVPLEINKAKFVSDSTLQEIDRRNVIICGDCDSQGNRLYCFGPTLDFINHFPEARGSSYAAGGVAAKCVILKRKLQNYYGRTFSKEEVWKMAKHSTGKTRSDSAGYGIININFPFWEVVKQIAEVQEYAVLPETFCLEQNYPNPFNATTTIVFNLQNSDYVRLIIYNIKGEQVAELVDGWRPIGEHSVQWNAGGLASGKYILVLQTERGAQTKNMILLK